MSSNTFQVAIDGPVAAGKGTISRLLAEKLKFLYVDTGATYRVATLMAMRKELSFDDLDKQVESEVSELVSELEKTNLELFRPREGELDGRLITVLIDGEDVSWAIRDEEVSRRVALVAKIPEVRQVLVKKQQIIASNQDVVMEGRDITYRVLPDAQLKIYLDADAKERAQRRYSQLLDQGKSISFEEVYKDLLKRDEIDMNRETDPLKIVEGAWKLDTTSMEIEEVVEMIVEKVKELSW